MNKQNELEAKSIVVQLSPRKFAVVPLTPCRAGSVHIREDGESDCVWIRESSPVIIFADHSAARKWIVTQALPAFHWTSGEKRFVDYVQANAKDGKTLKLPGHILWDAMVVPNERIKARRRAEKKSTN